MSSPIIIESVDYKEEEDDVPVQLKEGMPSGSSEVTMRQPGKQVSTIAYTYRNALW